MPLAQAQAQIDNAQAQYDAAMASRAQLAEQLDTAQMSLDQVQDGLAQVDGGIAQATAGIDTLKATIDQLQQQIDVLPADDPARLALEQQKAGCEQQLAQTQEELAGLQQQKQTLEGQKTQLEGAISQLKGGIAQIDSQTAGVAESLSAARSELAAQKEAAENGFATAQQSLDAALSQLQSGAGQLESGKAQLAEGQAQYDEGFAQWQAGSSELAQKRADAQSQFADAEAQLEEAQAKVDDIATMDADVYTLDLKKNMGVESYRSDAGRIDQIAQVFPLLFFLVAALVSLTTMTRMVDEDRMLIGTYKALGYSNARITGKYLGYAAIASGVGSIVGILALSTFLPWFIMEAYAIIYAVPCRPVPIDMPIALSSAGLGIGITVLATWFAVAATLREKPSTLMLPRAPKAGKRILLERIRPVWSRLTFSWKVTARNLFRYKRRFCMPSSASPAARPCCSRALAWRIPSTTSSTSSLASCTTTTRSCAWTKTSPRRRKRLRPSASMKIPPALPPGLRPRTWWRVRRVLTTTISTRWSSLTCRKRSSRIPSSIRCATASRARR